MRRIEIASGGSPGSPSARAAIMGALAGQLSANRGITAEATQQQGAVLAQGAVAEQNANAAQVNDASQQRLLELRGAQDANVENIRQTGDTTRTGLTEAGANTRNDASIAGNLQVAKLDKAQYKTDANGALSIIEGATANPVQTADGKPYTPQDNTDKLTLPKLFDGYNERVKAINDSYQPPDVKAAQLQALNAEPIYAPLMAAQKGAAGTPAAGTTADKVPKGAPTAKNPKTGQRMFQNPATGQWEPIL